MGQCLAHQPPVALARGQAVALRIRCVDARATPVGPHDPDRVAFGTEDDLPLNFDHAAAFAPLLDLRLTQVRVHQAPRLLARAARARSDRGWLRCAGVGDQRGDVGRQLVTGEEGGPPIGPGLESGKERPRLRVATVMAEMAYYAQSAGQCQGAPDPSVADLRGVFRTAVGLLFLMKVQSSSIWTWVMDRSRMIAALTAAAC